MALLVGVKPSDSDGNSYPDQIAVQAFLYAQPHPTSIHEPGAFVFELYPAGASTRRNRPLATWRFDAEQVERAQFNSRLFARGYGFHLSLLEVGGDVYPSMTANLVSRFEPADGRPPVESHGVRIIQIGRGTAASASARSP